jgi:hypothetical protein
MRSRFTLISSFLKQALRIKVTLVFACCQFFPCLGQYHATCELHNTSDLLIASTRVDHCIISESEQCILNNISDAVCSKQDRNMQVINGN